MQLYSNEETPVQSQQWRQYINAQDKSQIKFLYGVLKGQDWRCISSF